MGHEYQDRVSLELARMIAAELPQRPEWIVMALDNLDRWTARNHDAPGLLRCYAEWRAILGRPVEEVCRVLTEKSDEGQRLRQSSPFAGAIPYAVVWDVKRRVRDEQNAA
ncbi:MAG: hypothetical protein SFY69_09160 [Planctomycetota bacterium]|nr:hypothetical protein [Planctomycetota bacterium]